MNRKAYAHGTTVTADRSMIEVRRLLSKHGITDFVSGQDGGVSGLLFKVRGRAVRIAIPNPDPNDPRLCRTPSGRPRRDHIAREHYEQEVRRRWRVLVIAMKAKLELIEAGVSTFEEEFLAHFILPAGRTVGEQVLPELDSIQRTGALPALLSSPADAQGSTS